MRDKLRWLPLAAVLAVGCDGPLESRIDGSGGGLAPGAGGSGSGGYVQIDRGTGGSIGSGGATGGGGAVGSGGAIGSGGTVGSGGAAGSGGSGWAGASGSGGRIETYLPECPGSMSLCGVYSNANGTHYMWKARVWNSLYWTEGRARCATCGQAGGCQGAFDYTSSAGGEAFRAICVASCDECAY